MPKDPICGTVVEEVDSSLSHYVEGMKYYFCSNKCLSIFAKPSDELKQLKRSLILGILLTLPIVVLTYTSLLPVTVNKFVLFFLSTPVQFWIGLRFYKGFGQAIKERTANMYVLIAVGTSTAWVYSSFITFFPNVFPFNDVYFETSSVIIILVLTGIFLEHKTKAKALYSVRKLFDLQPRTATVLKDGYENIIPVENIQRNDTILIRPGEKIPADSTILDGSSYVDQSAITGESVPVFKTIGNEIIGGTINKHGFLKAKVTHVGQDSVLSQIINLVEGAKTGKVPLQRLVDKISSYFVPVIVSIAIISSLSWFFFGGVDLTFSILIFISVIIISCPCAIGIATPTALMMGVRKAAENGILIKGGETMEISRKVNTIVFDKTGTLTEGHPSVTDIIALNEFDDLTVLQLAAILEKKSEHPLAEAILNKATEKKLILGNLNNFNSFPGFGVTGIYNEQKLMLGNRSLLKKNNIVITHSVEEKLINLEKTGKTTVLLCLDETVIGIIGIKDMIKKDSFELIHLLKKRGMEIILLTGDNKTTAEKVGKTLDIEKVFSDVLPNQKEEVIRRLKQEGKIVAMVGDGINDAPAMASADVGIAIGSGTDIAKETAGIVLLEKNLLHLVSIFEIASKTSTKIKQNLAWAFGYNAALVPIAAGAFIPFFGLDMYLFFPFIAAGVTAFSDATVIGNSLLLSRYKGRTKISKTR